MCMIRVISFSFHTADSGRIFRIALPFFFFAHEGKGAMALGVDFPDDNVRRARVLKGNPSVE